MTVEVDGRALRKFKVLGRGSAGFGDTQFQHNGNTPTGLWEGKGWQDTSRKIRLLTAPTARKFSSQSAETHSLPAQFFHRDLFRIHGGGLDPRPNSPWYGGLNPTNGCLRLSNQDIKTLSALLYNASIDDEKRVCAAPKVWVNVQEGDTFDDEDDGTNTCSMAPYNFLSDTGGITFRRTSQ